jgi:predicted DNA-binding protein
LTPAQRNRAKGPPKKQINFRASQETEEQLRSLAKHFDKSVTDIIALAVETLAGSIPNLTARS